MKRVRITISISQNVAREVDSRIDGTHIRNRSHAIESLLSESLQLSSIKTAVILAGGKDATKRIPAIEESIKQLRSFGIYQVIIAVGFLGKEIINHFGENGEKVSGVKITYHHSNNGTGGALYELKSKLKRSFFVINVKEPTRVDISNLIKFHTEHKPTATVAIRSLRDLEGYYLFEPEVFNYIPKGFSSLEDELFVTLTKEGKLLSYPVLN